MICDCGAALSVCLSVFVKVMEGLKKLGNEPLRSIRGYVIYPILQSEKIDETHPKNHDYGQSPKAIKKDISCSH